MAHTLAIAMPLKRRRSPYDAIDPAQLIARDWLALSRSRLANERTLLAYIRTALALAGLGAIVAKWFEHDAALAAAIVMVAAGVLTGLLGVLRFATEERRLRPLERRAETDDHPGPG